MENKSLDVKRFTRRRKMLKNFFRYALEILVGIAIILILIEIFV